MNEHIAIKPDQCKACKRCEAACMAAHSGMSLKEAMKNRDVLVSRVHVLKDGDLKTSVRCHQCSNAPCCKICPTGALAQDENGQISVREELCIACEMCVRACPYGAVSMDNLTANQGRQCTFPQKRVAVRCDLCTSWRLENGKEITACMEACPVRALYLVQSDGSVLEPPVPQKKAVGQKSDASA